MHFTFDSSMSLQTFFNENDQLFEQTLLAEAEETRGHIRRILQTGHIDLLQNARQVITYTLEGDKEQLQTFGRHEGEAWAVAAIDPSFKLKWVHALRRAVWMFIEQYHQLTNETDRASFFLWEREVNDCLDLFLNTFVLSYTTYKEDVLQEQEQLVQTLSAPIIPVSTFVSILPVIGTMDERRAESLIEKVLHMVAERKIRTLIVDLSGLEYRQAGRIDTFNNVIDGVSLMGCEIVMTGVPTPLAQEMATSAIVWKPHVKTLGSLQQAFQEYL